MEKERQERDGSAPCTFQVLSPPMLKDIQLKCSSTSRVGRSSHVGVSLQVGIYIYRVGQKTGPFCSNLYTKNI